MLKGGCHCGAVRYEISGEVAHHAICHCSDCRRSAGVAGVSWICFPAEGLRFDGEVRSYASSEGVERQFCPNCGTGLFYYNEGVLPGLVDIQSATLDDAGDHPPSAHIQMAEALPWEVTAHELPRFDRYPGG